MSDQIQPEWLTLKALVAYASVSERTLRTWIHSRVNPLPAVQRGGKILVRRTTFDAWLEQHSIEKQGANMDDIVSSLVRSVTDGR